MTDLKIFDNEEFGAIRVIDKNGEPWFVGKDAAIVLGYQNGSRDINRHVDEEDRIKEKLPQYRNGTLVSETILVNESGLYSLIFSSKLPKAKEFKHWVTSEVLPSIRKTGNYSLATTYPNKSTSVAEYAKLIHEERMAMTAQHSSPQKIASQVKLSLEEWGLPVIKDFVEPEFPQQVTITCTSYLTIGSGEKEIRNENIKN